MVALLQPPKHLVAILANFPDASFHNIPGHHVPSQNPREDFDGSLKFLRDNIIASQRKQSLHFFHVTGPYDNVQRGIQAVSRIRGMAGHRGVGDRQNQHAGAPHTGSLQNLLVGRVPVLDMGALPALHANDLRIHLDHNIGNRNTAQHPRQVFPIHPVSHDDDVVL